VNPNARPFALGVLGRGVVDPDEAVIHADDLGLLRGQAAFETLRVYRGRPFALAEHLERLAASAERMGLPPIARDELEGLARTVLEATGATDCSMRFTLTGGREASVRPVALVTLAPLPADLEAVRARGMAFVSLQLGIDPRLRRDAPWLLGGVKSTSYAVNMAAWAEARRRGADDAVFLAAGGTVLEGPVTNVWWRDGDVLSTPSLDLGILAGVTRAHLVRLAADLGYRVEEGWFPVARMAAADEAFSSSSVREIMPIVGLDGRPIGAGRPGPAATRLQAALRSAAGADGAP
jgi:4-amino-4-deoxychorismate lyase